MPFEKLKKTAMAMMAFLGLAEIPLNAEKTEVNFSDDQLGKLKAQFGDDFVANIKTAFNKELKEMHDGNLELKAIQDEVAAMLEEAQLSDEEKAKLTNGNGSGIEATEGLKAIKAKMDQHEKMIQKLMNEPIGDVAEAINKNGASAIKHSASHLFASNKDYDAFDGRNWNKRALNRSLGATDFTSQPTIQKLNDDMDLYFRENPDTIVSLQRDNFGLPTFWPKRTKVDDRVADASIGTAEISQARKLPWLPKNKQMIQPEEGKIFPIQIDIEFVGYYLQKIEASWLNMMNKEGSQPYKMSFVKFLVSELDKKARVEDRIATIKGIYVATPDNATEGGRFINRQNGLLYLLQQARDFDKKYRAFDLGLPTATNIVDYVDNMIKRLPHEVREATGVVFYLSDEWLRAYKRRFETIYGTNNDYTGYPTNPKDYPNIKFERLVDLSGTDFMFITFDDNIEILENVPAEKSMYKFEMLKRMIYVMADYKLGIRLKHIGNVVDAGDPDEFKVQTVWSNTVPVFGADTFVPVHENGSTTLKLVHPNVYVTKDRTSTITEISNKADYAGKVIKIKGNESLVASLNVVHSVSKLKLAGNANFDLKSGGTLTLFVPADGGIPFEISRTTAPETTPVEDVTFNTGVIDANEGSVFKFNGVATTAITEIVNGVQGKTISIYGTDTASVDVTLSSVGNISVASAATLGASTHYIQLTLIDGVWTETKRVTA